MNEIALVFTPDGTGHGLYTEMIDLSQIGRLAVERATLIEFDNRTQHWRVIDATGFSLFSHLSREACLNWERQHLQTQEDQKHELPIGARAITAGA